MWIEDGTLKWNCNMNHRTLLHTKTEIYCTLILYLDKKEHTHTATDGSTISPY